MFIRNNSIKNNKATSVSGSTDIVLGGGLDIFYDVGGVVSGNDVSFNEVEAASGHWCYGAGVMVEIMDFPSPDFTFENNVVSGNNFMNGECVGGGLCIYTSGGTYQNNIVQKNHATNGGGIAVEYNSVDNQAMFFNITITENDATTAGGGMAFVSADAVVVNSIVWGNTAESDHAIYDYLSTLEVRYSDVEGELRPSCNGFDMGADEKFCVGVEESSVVGRQSSACPDCAARGITCYPNPTSGPTEFLISNFDHQQVSLTVYNAQGHQVATVLNGALPAGEHTINWNAENMPSGIYYYRLTTADRLPTTSDLRPLTGKLVKY